MKYPPSAGFAEFDRPIRRAAEELLPIGSKPAKSCDICDREPFFPTGQVPKFQLIVSATSGECVSIWREPDRIEKARIPAQRIKIVTPATPPKESPLELSLIHISEPT